MNGFKHLLLICIVTALFSQIIVFAADKEYTIKSANFDVQLLENGDAAVTETWVVNFTKGNFTRFYVERYLNVPKLEKFSEIAYHSFTINGQKCTLNSSNNRIPGTYSVTSNGEYQTYAWYMNAKNEIVIFETKYTLKQVVKYTKHDYALFCYRFVGKKFEKEIESLNIKLYAPSQCFMDVRYGNQYNPSIGANSISFSKRNSKGLVKINVAMPKAVFDTTIPFVEGSRLNTFSFNLHDIYENLGVYFVFIIVIAYILYRIIRFMKKFLYNIKINTRLTKTANVENEVKSLLDKLMKLNISPIEYNRILGEPFIAMNAFRLIFLDLIRRGVISIDKISLYIDTTKFSMLKHYEREFIDILLNTLPFNTLSQEKGILLSTFMTNLTLKQKQISHLMNNLRKNLKVSQRNKVLKDNCDLLKAYFNHHRTYLNTSYNIFKYYERNSSIDLNELYYLASTTPITSKIPKSNDFLALNSISSNLYEAFYEDLSSFLDSFAAKYIAPIITFRNRGDDYIGGSSCSSCSSCSGCGGGGAD